MAVGTQAMSRSPSTTKPFCHLTILIRDGLTRSELLSLHPETVCLVPEWNGPVCRHRPVLNTWSAPAWGLNILLLQGSLLPQGPEPELGVNVARHMRGWKNHWITISHSYAI